MKPIMLNVYNNGDELLWVLLKLFSAIDKFKNGIYNFFIK